MIWFQSMRKQLESQKILLDHINTNPPLNKTINVMIIKLDFSDLDSNIFDG